jgi:hypothetical protein
MEIGGDRSIYLDQGLVGEIPKFLFGLARRLALPKIAEGTLGLGGGLEFAVGEVHYSKPHRWK